MKYGFITWRAHCNDRLLDEEFTTILRPVLFKCDKYIFVVEDKGTPSQHYHAVISLTNTADISNLRAKFITQPFKLFYKSILERKLNTVIDPEFDDKALQLKMVKVDKDGSDHDYIKTLGYTSKDGYILDSKGYSEEFVTTAINYYWQVTRKESQGNDEKQAIIDIKVHNRHTLPLYFSKKHGISLKSKTLVWELAEHGIYCSQLSTKMMVRVIAELNLTKNKNEDMKWLNEVELDNYRSDLSDQITTDIQNEKMEWYTKYMILGAEVNEAGGAGELLRVQHNEEIIGIRKELKESERIRKDLVKQLKKERNYKK